MSFKIERTDMAQIVLFPDKTLAFQLAIFIFTFLALHALVFKPVLRILERRRDLTVKVEAEAGELNVQAAELLQSCQHQIEAAREKGIALKEALRKEGEKQAEQLLLQARHESELYAEKTRQEILRQTQAARLVLQGQSEEFSKHVVAKILGKKVSA